MLDTWQRFLAGQPVGGDLSGFILESWERCRSFQLDAARANLRRIGYSELRERLDRNAAFIEAARPHVRAVLASLEPLQPLVIMVTDADGVIIDSVGNAPEVMSQFGLVPGYDWSERAMGTNGIGTALAFGAPVAVVGDEHYIQTWHNNTCVGAPIRGPDGRLIGAVDICTSAADGDPARLVLVSFLSHLISRSLGDPSQGLESFAGPETLERASAKGSSAPLAALQRHARDLDALSQAMVESARLPLDGAEEIELAGLLADVARRVGDVSLTLPEREAVKVRGLRRRYELALTHLVELTRRRGGSGAVTVRAELHPERLHICVAAPGRASVEQPSPLETTGLSLGLWLAREIVTALGGTLSESDAPAMGYVLRLERSRVSVG